MILKIEDFSSFLSIAYLGLSIAVVLIYELSRKDSFDPFSGIVVFSSYFLFELVFVPLVRAIAMSDHYEWGSWYGRTGWLDNDFVVYTTTFNVFAFWSFVVGYYAITLNRSSRQTNDAIYRLRQRSHLWISMVVSVSTGLLVLIQVYWLTALGEGINVETILRRAVFERAAVYNFDPSLSFVVSLMQILAGIVTIVILAAFVPLFLNSKNKIYKLNWIIALLVVLTYGAFSGYRLPIIWPLVTPFVLFFYFGKLSHQRLKKVIFRVGIAFIFIIILFSHLQSKVSTSVAEHGGISLSSLTIEGESQYITKFLNDTVNLVSRDTFAAIWGIINYYSENNTKLNGQTFMDMMVSIIPRRIWSDKKMVYGADEITFHMNLPLTTHTTIGIHGELFANFGYIGAMLMLLYGWIFGYIDKNKRENEVTLLVFATYLGIARALVHFDFGFTALFISAYTGLCYWLVLRVTFYKKIKSDRFEQAMPAR
jgi:oligosaccharide repeat unit polymerase